MVAHVAALLATAAAPTTIAAVADVVPVGSSWVDPRHFCSVHRRQALGVAFCLGYCTCCCGWYLCGVGVRGVLCVTGSADSGRRGV